MSSENVAGVVEPQLSNRSSSSAMVVDSINVVSNQVERDELINSNNEIPIITVVFDNKNTTASIDEKPTIYPDAKELAYSDYTESSHADDDDDIDNDAEEDGSTITTIATSTTSDPHGNLHLNSRGVKWPISAVVDGTIDPTTATIVAAVRAISRVVEQNKVDEEPIAENAVDRNQLASTIGNNSNENIVNNSALNAQDNKLFPETENNTNGTLSISNIEIVMTPLDKPTGTLDETKNFNEDTKTFKAPLEERNNSCIPTTRDNNQNINITWITQKNNKNESNQTTHQNEQLTHILQDLNRFDEQYQRSKAELADRIRNSYNNEEEIETSSDNKANIVSANDSPNRNIVDSGDTEKIINAETKINISSSIETSTDTVNDQRKSNKNGDIAQIVNDAKKIEETDSIDKPSQSNENSSIKIEQNCAPINNIQTRNLNENSSTETQTQCNVDNKNSNAENILNSVSDIVWITQTEDSNAINAKNELSSPQNGTKNESSDDQVIVNENTISNSQKDQNEPITSVRPNKVHFQIPDKKDSDWTQQQPRHQQSNEEYSDIIDDYERNLRRHTCETLELVDKLCEQSIVAQQRVDNKNNEVINASAIPTQRIPWNGELFSNSNSENSFDLDVVSLHINPSLMIAPIDCMVLPGQRLFIMDNELGILLVDLQTKKILRSADAPQSTMTKWRYPKCCTFIAETDHILMLAECCSIATPKHEDKKSNDSVPTEIPTLATILEPKPTEYALFICRFDAKTLRLENRVEAPKFIRDKIITHCHLCYVEQTKCIYLAVNTPNDAFVYELNADCRWSEVYNRRGRTFIDLVFFAVIGPVTELLVLETNKQHVLLLSVYDSEVVAQKMVAVSEKPAALTVDDDGIVFAFDRASSRIAQHSRLHFDRLRDIALIERAHCRLSAREHLLAVLVRGFNQLKLYKY